MNDPEFLKVVFGRGFFDLQTLARTDSVSKTWSDVTRSPYSLGDRLLFSLISAHVTDEFVASFLRRYNISQRRRDAEEAKGQTDSLVPNGLASPSGKSKKRRKGKKKNDSAKAPSDDPNAPPQFVWQQVDCRRCTLSGETIESIGEACGYVRQFLVASNRIHSFVRLGKHCESAVVYSGSAHNHDNESCDLVHIVAKPRFLVQLDYEDLLMLVSSNYSGVDDERVVEATRQIYDFYVQVIIGHMIGRTLGVQLRDGPRLIGWSGEGPWMLVCLDPRRSTPDLYVSSF